MAPLTPIFVILLTFLVMSSASARQSTDLGSPWESRSAGIVLRPPAGSNEITRAGSGDEIVTFVDEKRSLRLVVSRLRFSQPVPLTATTTEDRQTLGLVELRLQDLKTIYPDSQVMRSDLAPLAETDAAIIAVRLLVPDESNRDALAKSQVPRLVQTAIIRASPTTYYTLEFTSPGAAPGTPESFVDDREAFAVQLFSAIADSVKLLDQGAIREDQTARLDRTRALFVELTPEAIKSVLVPKQYFRILSAGKDIGYTYFIEEPVNRTARDGVLIGIRAFTRPPTDTETPSSSPVTVTADSWLFVSFDRAREEWSSTATIQSLPTTDKPAPDKPRTLGQFGTSIRRADKIVEQGTRPGEADEVRTRETYYLEVTPIVDQVGTEPVRRDLPVFYFPQALGHLLPRLIASENKTYFFASWVSDKQEIMARYVDVLGIQEVKLAGRTFRAVVIQDRIGLEGTPTFHYVSPPPSTPGAPYLPRYLGSSTPSARVELVPADEATIRRAFPDADFSRPAEPERVVTRRKPQPTPKP